MTNEREGLERAVIALAARGLMTVATIEAVPSASFSSEARLFAWACASHAARTGAPSFFLVRGSLVTAPRLDLPLEIWARLMRETEAEIAAAERITTLDPRAVEQLLRLTQDDTDEGDDRR